jgi:hypothetical protein
MAEISTTAIYSINPLDIYQRGEKSDREKPADSQTPRQTPEADSPNAPATQDRVTLSREAQQINQLASTDRKVRSHEAAHSAAGGQFAGGPSYTYQHGPDGKRYAVAGEVPIDLSPVPGNPEATIRKAQVVRAAAQAPADPSPQDRQVAAAATRMELSARAELQTAKQAEAVENRQQSDIGHDSETGSATGSPAAPQQSLNLYA